MSADPPHDKTDKMACAPSKDLDQPLGIRPVWSPVRMKKAWVLSYSLSAQRRLCDQTGRILWLSVPIIHNECYTGNTTLRGTICRCILKIDIFLHWRIKEIRQVSHDMSKPTKWVCTQRRLTSAWASAQSDQSSQCAQWVAKDPSFLHADSKDSDQTWQMPRLIQVFAGCTLFFVGFVMSWLRCFWFVCVFSV